MNNNLIKNLSIVHALLISFFIIPYLLLNFKFSVIIIITTIVSLILNSKIKSSYLYLGTYNISFFALALVSGGFKSYEAWFLLTSPLIAILVISTKKSTIITAIISILELIFLYNVFINEIKHYENEIYFTSQIFFLITLLIYIHFYKKTRLKK